MLHDGGRLEHHLRRRHLGGRELAGGAERRLHEGRGSGEGESEEGETHVEEAGRRGGSVVSPDTTAIELARLILPGRSAPSANFANNEVPSLRLAAGQHQRLDVQRAAEPNLFARNRHAS